MKTQARSAFLAAVFALTAVAGLAVHSERLTANFRLDMEHITFFEEYIIMDNDSSLVEKRGTWGIAPDSSAYDNASLFGIIHDTHGSNPISSSAEYVRYKFDSLQAGQEIEVYSSWPVYGGGINGTVSYYLSQQGEPETRMVANVDQRTLGSKSIDGTPMKYIGNGTVRDDGTFYVTISNEHSSSSRARPDEVQGYYVFADAVAIRPAVLADRDDEDTDECRQDEECAGLIFDPMCERPVCDNGVCDAVLLDGAPTSCGHASASDEADLSVYAELEYDPIVVGDTFSLEITGENFGPSDVNAAYAVITPSTGFEVSYYSSSDCYETNGTLYCNIERTIGDSSGVDFGVGYINLDTRPNEVTCGDTVTVASVSVGSEAHDPDQSNNTYEVSATIECAVDLEITTEASEYDADVGETLTFTVDVDNMSGTPINTDAIVSIDIPFGAEIDPSSIYASNGACTATNNAISCTYDRHSFYEYSESEMLSFSATVTEDADCANGLYINTILTTHGINDTDTADNQHVHVVEVNCSEPDSADLTAYSEFYDDTIQVGETTRIDVTAYNSGPSNAVSAFAVVTPAPGIELSFIETSCFQNGSTVMCDFGTMNIEGVHSSVHAIEFQVTATEAAGCGVIENAFSYTVQSATPDPDQSNNTHTASLTVECDTESDLSFDFDVKNDEGLIGEPIEFTARIRNQGPADSQTVLVRIIPPGGLKLTLLSELSPPECETKANGLEITCDYDVMSAGYDANVVFVGIANEEQFCGTTAEVFGQIESEENVDPYHTNNVDLSPYMLDCPFQGECQVREDCHMIDDLHVCTDYDCIDNECVTFSMETPECTQTDVVVHAVDGNANGYYAPGDSLHVLFQVENSGIIDAEEMKYQIYSDYLVLNQASIFSDDCEYNESNNTLECPYGTLEAGEADGFAYNFTVREDACTWSSSADITIMIEGETEETDYVNNIYTTSIALNCEPPMTEIPEWETPVPAGTSVSTNDVVDEVTYCPTSTNIQDGGCKAEGVRAMLQSSHPVENNGQTGWRCEYVALESGELEITAFARCE